VSLGGVAAFGAFALTQGIDGPPALVCLGALVTGLYLASSLRLGAWGMLRGTMTIALGMSIWFGVFALGDHDALYGVRLSFAASLGLLFATLAEGWRLLGLRLLW
jgi:hypothetical protein